MSKKIKALLAVVLCAAMLIAAASPAFAAVDDNGVLRFNKDGKLKIMQISDTQDIDIPREAMIMFMEKALDAEKPDLVVFTGDQIAGGKIKTAEGVYAGIKAILKPVTDRGIPFTFVFGNHDTDEGCPVSRDEQLAYYQTLPGCLAYDAVPEMYGSGTHNLPIYASKGNDIKFNLWLFDSNDYDRENGGYDYVHQDQIDWYVKTSEELEKKAGHPVPSIAFQHIIVPEVAELLVDSPFKGENAISKKLNGQNKLLMLKPGKTSGMMLEFPCMGDYAQLVDDAGRTLFFTHGHIFGAGFQNSVDNLPALLADSALVYGHTHVKVNEPVPERPDIWAFNPGSVGIPKDGSHSFGIYESGKPLAEAFRHVVLEEA